MTRRFWLDLLGFFLLGTKAERLNCLNLDNGYRVFIYAAAARQYFLDLAVEVSYNKSMGILILGALFISTSLAQADELDSAAIRKPRVPLWTQLTQMSEQGNQEELNRAKVRLAAAISAMGSAPASGRSRDQQMVRQPNPSGPSQIQPTGAVPPPAIQGAIEPSRAPAAAPMSFGIQGGNRLLTPEEEAEALKLREHIEKLRQALDQTLNER